MKKKRLEAPGPGEEISSLNHGILDVENLDCETLEQILGGGAETTCWNFSGPCPGFSGTCINYSSNGTEIT